MPPEAAIDPLFAEHREECGEERGCQAGVEYGLDSDDARGWTGPEGRVQIYLREERAVYGVDEDLHVTGGKGTWKPVITSWEHCEDRFTVLRLFLLRTI